MSLADPLGFAAAARVLVMMGFFGGLATVSTFSPETTTLLVRARYGWGWRRSSRTSLAPSA
jgi:fluoride ion exporter CrcB/FEX